MLVLGCITDITNEYLQPVIFARDQDHEICEIKVMQKIQVLQYLSDKHYLF